MNNGIVLTELNIESLDPDDLEFYVFELITKSKNLTYMDQYGIIDRMDEIEKAIVGTHILEGEVKNGGFNQFFFNYGGYFGQEAYDGCLLMKSEEYLPILEQAFEIYNNEADMFDNAVKIGGKEGFKILSEKNFFDKLDDDFYKLDSLRQARIEFIKRNKSLFINK